jgi:non-specific serine/threonine protein kinase/serine/threonine-protein kinase
MSERDVFIAALQKEVPAERLAYLDAACAGRPELRRQVEGLLRLHEGAGSFLERPAAGPPATGAFPDATEQAPSLETPGAVIGNYKLVEPVGEGGMGSVWMSQQEPVKRLVALKLIKARMDSRQVLAQFEAERQALALMDHPNIARVLDGGTTAAGRPKEAKAAYEEALAVRKYLADEFPNRPELRHDLARSHFNLGTLFQATNRVKEAEAAYSEGLGHF